MSTTVASEIDLGWLLAVDNANIPSHTAEYVLVESFNPTILS